MTLGFHGAIKSDAQEQGVWLYAQDTDQRRILSQQGAASQADMSAGTQRSAFQPGSHPLGLSTTYTSNSQPARAREREFVWDALGRLTKVLEVREEAKTVASYAYDHRGLRVGKQVGA